MTIHGLNDASEMNLHNLPVEPRLQLSYADMDGPFEAVTAQVHDDQATGGNIDITYPKQQTVSDESPCNSQVLPLDDRLQTLCNTYYTSYAFPITTNSAHMQHAKDFALALLQRYYPTSQQYRVESAALGPLARFGINVILKEPHEPDADPDTLKRPSKSINTLERWHNIGPEKIAALVIKKGSPEALADMETLTWCTHTYLYIVLDDLSSFHRWSAENENCRGDILTDLGTLGGVERGYGMLLFGPRLELYSYDADNVKLPVKPYQNPNWRMDMRHTSLVEVDEVLRGFVTQKPVYKDGR